MKNTLLLLILWQLGGNVYCQQALSVQMKDATLVTVFKAIEKQSDYRFYYSNDVVPAKQSVHINVRNVALREVMAVLLEGLSLSWKLIDENRVIIYRKPQQRQRIAAGLLF